LVVVNHVQFYHWAKSGREKYVHEIKYLLRLLSFDSSYHKVYILLLSKDSLEKRRKPLLAKTYSFVSE